MANYRKYNNRPKKRSGASWHLKNDKPYILAWRFSGGELMSVIIFPYHGTKRVESRNGNVFENWICKVTKGGITQIYPCLVNIKDRRAIIKQLGLVASTKTNYFGSYRRK